MIRTMVLAAAVSASIAAPAALAQVSVLPTPAFIRTAAATDAYERRAGRMATRQAANPRVRNFGRMMVRDHTRTTADLKAAIRRARLPPPPVPMLTPEQQSNILALRRLRGPGFDRAYMQQQVQTHVQALRVFRAYAAGGDNPVLRGAAASTVPIIQRHLTLANRILR